jgi:ABC-type transporter Mla subunit MlaD
VLQRLIEIVLKPFTSPYRLHIVELAERASAMASDAMQRLRETREELVLVQVELSNLRLENHDLQVQIAQVTLIQEECQRRLAELENKSNGE